MLRKKAITEQRNHLGAHLKNTCMRVFEHIDELRTDCVTITDMRIKLEELERWLEVPFLEACAYSPFGKYDDEELWEERKASDKFTYLTRGDADDVIAPTVAHLNEFMLVKLGNNRLN